MSTGGFRSSLAQVTSYLPTVPEWVAELTFHLGKTMITWTVPAACVGTVVVVASMAVSKAAKQPERGEEGDEDDESRSLLQKILVGKPPKDKVKEYLKIDRLTERLESYSFSVTKATQSKRKARALRARAALARNIGAEMTDLTDGQLTKIAELQKAARTALASASSAEKAALTGIRKLATQDSKAGSNKKQAKVYEKQLAQAAKTRAAAEVAFIEGVNEELDKSQQERFASIIRSKGSSEGADGLLSLLGGDDAPAAKNNVFVLGFAGDVMASQVQNLRHEVTAVIQNSSAGDEVVVLLNSGGGTVTGYGLAAAQLVRIKAHGMKLTVCVEEVAASGGYMMACTADRLVASPMAILGSIGVVTQQPNLAHRLEREGVGFTEVTAGKYKRTLGPFKKFEQADFDKVQEDLEGVLVLFKAFVSEHRPKLDIDSVATGEVWFGQDALKQNLVDELKTSDDVLLELLKEEKEIYSVRFRDPERKSPLARLLSDSESSSPSSASTLSPSLAQSLGSALLSWLVPAAATQLAQAQPSSGIGKRAPMLADFTPARHLQ